MSPQNHTPAVTTAGRAEKTARYSKPYQSADRERPVFQRHGDLLAFFSLLPLLLILYYITKNGIAVIDWDFLARLPGPIGEAGGGIFNAIIGTGMLIILSSVLSIPFGFSRHIPSEKGRRQRSPMWSDSVSSSFKARLPSS